MLPDGVMLPCMHVRRHPWTAQWTQVKSMRLDQVTQLPCAQSERAPAGPSWLPGWKHVQHSSRARPGHSRTEYTFAVQSHTQVTPNPLFRSLLVWASLTMPVSSEPPAPSALSQVKRRP